MFNAWVWSLANVTAKASCTRSPCVKSKDHTKALNIPFTLTQGDLLQEALAVTFAKDQTQALNIPFTLTQGDLVQEALAVTFAKDQTQA
jgi:hypothetical protein